ncbi:hypothetical protein ZIOFF_009181 [Zingiber officinale]|uniref:Uncharacterized protein n=1 Tax=Zingiber officinale TaxID=94328 RepID=A0A8J5LRA2_ZINOF|nr:hypothetical protein ZIOFF_009181 [Zingiber officinale]
MLHQAVGLNTAGSVYRLNEAAEAEITGSPTEKALLSWSISDLGMCVDEMKKKCAVIRVEAFNSEKKRSGIWVEEKASGATITHWNGAAEMLLIRCSHYADGNGSVKLIDSQAKSELEAIVHDMAASSLHCIAFAYKNTARAEDSVVNHGEAPRLDDTALTLLGLVGLKDPCRPEVARVIDACRSAGVGVKMITGDNVFTARAIAVECGIIKPEDSDALVVEGQEFKNYSSEERMINKGGARYAVRRENANCNVEKMGKTKDKEEADPGMASASTSTLALVAHGPSVGVDADVLVAQLWTFVKG